MPKTYKWHRRQLYMLPNNHVHRYIQIVKSLSIVLHFISGMDLVFMWGHAKIYELFMQIRMIQNFKASGVETGKFQEN